MMMLPITQVRVFQAEASQADELRRAVQKEAEAAERAAATACKAHADAKEKLWRAEERLSTLLLKTRSMSRPASLDTLNGGYQDDAGWGVPDRNSHNFSMIRQSVDNNQPMQEAASDSIPSYYS